MPGHGLGGADGNSVGFFSQGQLYGLGLSLVVERCGGTVGVDVVDLGGLHPCSFKGQLDSLGRAFPGGSWFGYVVCVRGGGVSR